MNTWVFVVLSTNVTMSPGTRERISRSNACEHHGAYRQFVHARRARYVVSRAVCVFADCAVLCCAVLCCAVLCCAVLCPGSRAGFERPQTSYE